MGLHSSQRLQADPEQHYELEDEIEAVSERVRFPDDNSIPLDNGTNPRIQNIISLNKQ